MRLIDSHAHLQVDAFKHDAAEVVAAAELSGVERILVPGWDLASGQAAVELAHRHSIIDAAVGVHPHAAARVGEREWAALTSLALDPRVVAIGETGLDFDRLFAPIDAQLANLRRNVTLSLATGKPAIFHCRSRAGGRDAQDTLLAELVAAGFDRRAESTFGDRPAGVLHSFSGPVDYADRALELGLAISFSGLVFRSGEEASTEVARRVPIHRFLVETDSPYLSAPGGPRRRNEPMWVRVTARWLAEGRGVDPDELGAALVATYRRFAGR